MSRSYESGQITFDDSGMQEFEELMKQYAENVSEENALNAVEAGAKEFLNDLRKLPKPRSQINSPGYTHLINTFAMERSGKEIKVGWGKYYGPMVEHGTKKMASRAHLKPLFQQKKERYYRKMTERIFD